MTKEFPMPNDCGWTWVGWETPSEFDAVEIRHEASHPSSDFYIDNAQVDFVDEPCYADCDWSTGIGVLDIFDFLCFQTPGSVVVANPSPVPLVSKKNDPSLRFQP